MIREYYFNQLVCNLTRVDIPLIQIFVFAIEFRAINDNFIEIRTFEFYIPVYKICIKHKCRIKT